MTGFEKLRRTAVIGSGTIGHGVAQILALAGYEVIMVGLNEGHLGQSKEKIRWSLNKFVEKKKISKEYSDATLKRISLTTSCEKAGKDLDFAIEAVPENLDLKCKVFATLDSVAPSHAIFVSNTSTLSVTKMSKVTQRPDKIAGMHFFNPPQQMALVEVIRGEGTSQETIDTLLSLANKLGKTPIMVQKDVRGFIVNRILCAVLLEAFWTYQRGEATKEGIDASVKYKGGFPMGWFELADFAGLDIVYEVEKNLYEAYNERFKLCTKVIEPLVKDFKFGQKTGVGFYDWTNGRPKIPHDLLNEYDVERSWAVAINEAAWLIYDGAASSKDIDTGMKLGTYWPSGPCEYGDSAGLDTVVNRLKSLFAKSNMEIYNPCPLLVEYVNKGWTGKKAGRGFY
ncbi:MAG TPA: 3-hydroxyacyl-CoA dehydrogenase [Candidatus Bathyarchaeia archaeon]|nr:3-hydroxyacyl-CoA dehydrogenase [Candidatus Bathyarchaeia archaeon]